MSAVVAWCFALQSPAFISGVATSTIKKLNPFQSQGRVSGSIFPGCHHLKTASAASVKTSGVIVPGEVLRKCTGSETRAGVRLLGHPSPLLCPSPLSSAHVAGDGSQEFPQLPMPAVSWG